MPVYRTVLSWLQAGRDSVVIFNFTEATEAIIGSVLAEDTSHKRELDRALARAPIRVVVRMDARRATA